MNPNRKKTKHSNRIALGIFLPVLIQTVFILIAIFFESGMSIFEGFLQLPLALLFFLAAGYALTCIQTFMYAYLMEYVINPKVKNRYLVVICSMILGGLTGYSVALFFDLYALSESWPWIVLSGLNGLLMGVILNNSYIKEKISLSPNRVV